MSTSTRRDIRNSSVSMHVSALVPLCLASAYRNRTFLSCSRPPLLCSAACCRL